jgi:PAS domain S-box-containing protein
MHLAHHPIFVALSVLTAWFGAWTALDLFRRVQAHVGAWRYAWLAAAGLAMGLSIWSMHFIAMLGFNPGVEVRYDIQLTLLSLVLAIAATTFAFVSAGANRFRQLGSGLVMGAGICGMHYVGMAALITGAELSNEPVFVVLAFVIAVSASTGALIVAMRETTLTQRLLAAVALGFAIVGMHYTAIFGVRINADVSPHAEVIGIEPFVLAIAVAAGTLFILLLALIAAMSDRRFEAAAVREALRSERQLRAILDNLPMGIFVAASPSGDIRFANAEAERLLGHSLEGAAPWAHEGNHGAVNISGQRLGPEEHVLHKAMREQRRVGPQIQSYRRGDDALIQVEVTAAPIPDRDNGASLTVAAFQDVTAKLLAEEQARQAATLREAERNLQHINELLEQRVTAALAEKADAEAALMHAQRLESLGRLTGGVAHDFNNLLTVVIGALDVILRNPENAARRARLGEAALAAARRGERLTAQLLAFARRQPLQPETCDLNELIRECEPLLRRAASENVSLKLRLCPGKAIALIDPTQFEASLLNLVVNAIDASPAGGDIGIETEVVSAAGEMATEASHVRMTVWDCGQGMSADVASRVFEPFFTTKAPGKGTGLGLSQVYGFVKQSGGEVQVDSAPGEGTRMTVVLPLALSDYELAQTRSAIPNASPSSLHILLAEDDPSVAGITQTMLGELGHEVICTPNAEQALEVLSSTAQVDLLLTDVVMPGGMNGVELAKEAIKIRPGLSVLLSSGYAGESLDESVASGAWPFLRKPYLQSELADALARLAEERAAEESFPSHRRLAGSRQP